jgi:hypothetical protein
MNPSYRPVVNLPRPKPRELEGVSFVRAVMETEPSQQEVWGKGQVIPGHPPEVWRRDITGAVMRFCDYGDRNSDYGWESDHIKPVVLGGENWITNRQPLHWRNNAAKGDTYPWPPRGPMYTPQGPIYKGF